MYSTNYNYLQYVYCSAMFPVHEFFSKSHMPLSAVDKSLKPLGTL